jgi:hypothetical protein
MPTWITVAASWSFGEKLEVASLTLAIIALSVSIWDKVRVSIWDRFAPLDVTFERKPITWELPEPTVRFRLTVKNRVDYRTQVLLGTVETWTPPTPDLVNGPILREELRDQIDETLLGTTDGPKQMIADVEAFQRRHLVMAVVLRPGVPGILSPGATFLIGQHGKPRRYRGRRRSVGVTWDGTHPVFQDQDRPSILKR